MTNQEIAKLLRQVSAVYLLKDENRFKVIAYEKAADTIEKSNIEVKDLWEAGKLSDLPGIGQGIGSHLDELFRKGNVLHFKEVLSKLPASLYPLLDVPGFGPKTAYKLVIELKLKNPNTVINDLLTAAKSNKIASIEGFGVKSQQDIIEALERFKKGQGKVKRMPLSYAYKIASQVIDYLKKNTEVREVYPLGSLRRMLSTIGDIDIAVSTENPREVINWFLKYPKKEKLVEEGPSGATIIIENGAQIDLRVQTPEKFGAMLQYFTGSKSHNIKLRELALKKGLSLSEYGMKQIGKIKNAKLKMQNYNTKLKIYEFSAEEAFYNALRLEWIPPEIREDTGEIEAGQTRRLPILVENQDIKGDFHIHSNYDLEPSHDLGSSPLTDILDHAAKLKYEYIGVSDHNPSYTNHTSDNIISILKTRKAKFEQIYSSTKSVRVKLLIMLEIDILPNGKLAIPDEGFKHLDAAIVSVHSSFGMDKENMTKRIISGLSHSKAKVLAHPTGRLLGKREGYEVDWSKLFDFLKKNNKAIEINAYPDRLDLPDFLVREAIKKGVKLVIGTDSHDASAMNLMHFGVAVARRGWASKDDIINCLPYNKLVEWLGGE